MFVFLFFFVVGGFSNFEVVVCGGVVYGVYLSGNIGVGIL